MKRTLALILTVLMLVSMIPATLLSVIARGPGVLPNLVENQSDENAPYQYIPETVLIDGVLDDTAWPNEDWNLVNSDSGTWTKQYPQEANLTKFYKYQLKVDYYYLYGAVVMNSAPTGAVTLWLNDGSEDNCYTDKFVIDFANKSITRLDNKGNEIVSYAEKNGKTPYYYEEFEFAFGEENGKDVVEFRSHRADFCDTQDATFSYFVSAEFESGESLYHPAIAIQGLTGDAREACFPSTDGEWPAGAKAVTFADINGYGELSILTNTYIDIDGVLDDSIWAAQTQFYHKWYERTALPAWVDNQQGGALGSNVDSNGNSYKDFADVSANYLPYSETAQNSAKFELYVTDKCIYGAALVRDTYDESSSEAHSAVRFYMFDENGGKVQLDLRYDSSDADAETSTGADYARLYINGEIKTPQDLGIDDGADDNYFDKQYRNNYIYDSSYGRYYDEGYDTSANSWYDNMYTYGYSTLGLYYSQLPAGPDLFVFEFAIDRNAWGDEFKDFVPSNYSFASYSEIGDSWTDETDYLTYKNTQNLEYIPTYFKNPQGEYYTPYTAFAPDGTLGERFWPGMVASADNIVNSTVAGESTRADYISYMPLIRGNLDYMFGSVVIEVDENFGDWKPSTSNTNPDGDIFELWLAEAAGYNAGGTDYAYDGALHRYGIWMDEDGTAHIGAYYDGEYHGGGRPWHVVIKKYEDSVIKKPTYGSQDVGGVTNDYDAGGKYASYTNETHDYYVIEFAIPVDQLGDGLTFDINDENFNSENAVSAIANPIAYYYTSMHVAPADTETDNTTGLTMFYPRTDSDITDNRTISAITDNAITHSFPQVYNEHDIYFAFNVDGKIIEEQRTALNKHVIDASNSEYRIPSEDGNYLSYNSLVTTGSEYVALVVKLDGELVTGAYATADKTMVTLWVKDTGSGSDISRLDFFNDGEYSYCYLNGVAYSGYGAWAFSSANGETYFESSILTDKIDPGKDGFEYFVEVNQVINDETLSRVHPKVTLPVIGRYEEHFLPEDNVWKDNAGTIKRIEHFLPEAIDIDGSFNDNGWRNQWTFVSRDINACGQETSEISSLGLTEFYYQMRMDEDYLYVAAVIYYKWDDGTALTYDEIVSQQPGFRLWIKSGENGNNIAAGNSNTYTNYYDVKLDGLQSYDNTFPTYANNTRPFYTKFYQYVNPDANGDGYFSAADFASGTTSTINTVVGPENKFSTFKEWGYGDSTLWGETKVELLDSENGSTSIDVSIPTQGEMVDTGAIIKRIGELKKNGGTNDGDAAVEEYKKELANNAENPINISVSTGVEAAVMKSGVEGGAQQPNGFSTTLPENSMVVEFKVDLDEFGGREIFEYYISTATHNSWTSKTTMYPAIVSDPGSKSNYFHVNYPYWKWTDEYSFVVDEDVRAELMMRTYKRPVTTLGAKVSTTYEYESNETNAIRFGGLWNEEYIRKVNGLRESNGYSDNATTLDDNKAYDGDNSTGNYTDYWDVKAMGMVFMPTHLVKENVRADKNDVYSAHPGNYDLFVDTPGAAWMDADGIVEWSGPDGANNFCDYENFAFYVTLVNVPDNALNMNFCFRGFVTYYDDVSGATPYYDAILERSINSVIDAASSSTDEDKTYEDEALHNGPFTDNYYKPVTGTGGEDKENENQGGGSTEPQNVVINSIELTTDAVIEDGVTMFYPTVYSINGDTSLVTSAVKEFVAYWYDETGSTRLDTEGPSTITMGETYDLFTKLTCNTGYEFSDDCTMTLSVGGKTLTGDYFSAGSDDVTRAYDFAVTVEPEVYDIGYVNLSNNVYSGVTLLWADSEYQTSSGFDWWQKVLLEYDNNTDTYKVIATSAPGDTSNTSWSYGIDRVIVAAHDGGVNSDTVSFLASLAIGDRVDISGATLEALQAIESSSTGTVVDGLTIQRITYNVTKDPDPIIYDGNKDILEAIPNNTIVAYVPLDDRPVHTDRVKYLAAASGITLVMPDEDLYKTVINTDPEADTEGTHGGDPAAILTWLREQEAKTGAEKIDYYVIALDQVFSGGLVNSRYSDSTYSDTLVEHDLAMVEFLTDLAKNNYVVYTDTVMRLAATENYKDHTSDTYNALRAYGEQIRQDLTKDGAPELNLSNVISSYRYGENGVTAISYTNDDYTATEDQIKAYLKARERKLRIIDYLIKNAGGYIDRLYIGIDDSSSDWNLQANEIAYIKKVLSVYMPTTSTVFAGADEMGLMGIAALANDCFASDPIKVYFRTYGPALNSQADKYDNGTLSESLKAHLAAIGGVEVNTASEADIEILVLTRAQTDVSSTGDASTYAAQLATKLLTNLENDVPTAVIDASNHYGASANYAYNAMVSAGVFSREDAGELLGYSQWNTVGNAVGISMANAVARYAYLVSAETVTDASNYAFLQGYLFSMIKDNGYKTQSAVDLSYETFAWPIMNTLQGSYQYILGKDVVRDDNKGASVVSGYTGSWISDVVWPWGRAFECRFTLGLS